MRGEDKTKRRTRKRATLYLYSLPYVREVIDGYYKSQSIRKRRLRGEEKKCPKCGLNYAEEAELDVKARLEREREEGGMRR